VTLEVLLLAIATVCILTLLWMVYKRLRAIRQGTRVLMTEYEMVHRAKVAREGLTDIRKKLSTHIASLEQIEAAYRADMLRAETEVQSREYGRRWSDPKESSRT
jgi:hypothetical protein